MSLNIFIYNNHNILVRIGKGHWPKQYVMVTTKHLQFCVSRISDTGGGRGCTQGRERGKMSTDTRGEAGLVFGRGKAPQRGF